MSQSKNTLYGEPGCPECLLVMSALDYCGVEYELKFVEPKFRFSKEFKEKSVKGNVPVLETADCCLSDKFAILRWLARTQKRSLYGESLVEMAQVDTWLSLLRSDLCD